MIRFASEEDLPRVNAMRRQVNDVHVKGRPDIFKPGFPLELRDYIDIIWRDESKRIVVAERDGALCGYAVLQRVDRPETPFMQGRRFLEVAEFGVDEKWRRKGVAMELVGFIREEAARQGLHRIELDMWEFNEGALAFYEAAGFKTYRRYMEMEC